MESVAPGGTPSDAPKRPVSPPGEGVVGIPVYRPINTSTGVISGTPTTITSQTTFTVTATNAAGNTTGTVAITVVLGAPANLTYSNDPGIGYVSGGTFTTMSPSSTGGAVASYAISAALPAGLSLNTTTGDISGSPTASTSGFVNFTITATNAAGTTTKTISVYIY